MSKNFLQKSSFCLSLVVYIVINLGNQAMAGKIQDALRSAEFEANTQWNNHVVVSHKPPENSLPTGIEQNEKNYATTTSSSNFTIAVPVPTCPTCQKWNSLAFSIAMILQQYRDENI